MSIQYFDLSSSGLLLTITSEVVVAFLKSQIKEQTKREQWKVASQKFRVNCNAKATYLITQIWELFPSNGLDRVKADCLCDVNINYGGHQLSLGFDITGDEACEDQVIGTRSLGLRYENEHTVRLRGRDMCRFSEKHLQFLKLIHSSIFYRYPKLRKLTKDYMRVNLVAGAKTSPHTDTMRGATPNFFLVEPPEDDNTTPFCLQVRRFPNFKTSVVRLHGELFIPHKQKRSHLILIGVKDGNPHYYVYPTTTIEELEPYGDVQGYIVVGIKQQKLQVMSDEYMIYQSTDTMTLLTIGEVFAIAKNHPAKKPKALFSYYSEPGVWHTFMGWKHSHNLLKGTDYRKRRIHVFYRPVREETSAARLRSRKSNDEPINFTYVGCGPDKH
jgi:hypothetical protein